MFLQYATAGEIVITNIDCGVGGSVERAREAGRQQHQEGAQCPIISSTLTFYI